MRIQRKNIHVGVIYFVDDQGNRIRIPQGFILRDTTENEDVRPSRLYRWAFSISWIANYEIYLNDEKIVSLDNQKQQAIRGIDALAYSTTDSEGGSSSDDEDSSGGDENSDSGDENSGDDDENYEDEE